MDTTTQNLLGQLSEKLRKMYLAVDSVESEKELVSLESYLVSISSLVTQVQPHIEDGEMFENKLMEPLKDLSDLWYESVYGEH